MFTISFGGFGSFSKPSVASSSRFISSLTTAAIGTDSIDGAGGDFGGVLIVLIAILIGVGTKVVLGFMTSSSSDASMVSNLERHPWSASLSSLSDDEEWREDLFRPISIVLMIEADKQSRKKVDDAFYKTVQPNTTSGVQERD